MKPQRILLGMAILSLSLNCPHVRAAGRPRVGPLSVEVSFGIRRIAALFDHNTAHIKAAELQVAQAIADACNDNDELPWQFEPCARTNNTDPHGHLLRIELAADPGPGAAWYMYLRYLRARTDPKEMDRPRLLGNPHEVFGPLSRNRKLPTRTTLASDVCDWFQLGFLGARNGDMRSFLRRRLKGDVPCAVANVLAPVGCAGHPTAGLMWIPNTKQSHWKSRHWPHRAQFELWCQPQNRSEDDILLISHGLGLTPAPPVGGGHACRGILVKHEQYRGSSYLDPRRASRTDFAQVIDINQRANVMFISPVAFGSYGPLGQ